MKRFIIRKVLSYTLPKSSKPYPMKVIFADGSSFRPVSGEPEITMIFKTRGAEWRTLIFNYIGFCESYRNGTIDVEGPDALEKLVRMNYAIPKEYKRSNPLAWALQRIQEYRLDNKDFKVELDNLYRHYNLPAEFFHLMNGELYGYTEGYYETGAETQNEAQFKKYDYICKKLCLRPGNKVVEIGTAWGTMALLMAKRYGANVVNYGLIPEQNRVFEERIQKMGLGKKIKNVVRDARVLGEEKEQYDKYVSLGVYEHAGMNCYREWLENIASALKPGGIGVITFTGHMNHRMMEYFVGKYIWRGCYLLSLARVLGAMEDNDLHAVDIENSSFFYADTMRAMLGNLNKNWERIKAIDPTIFDEKFRRTWNIYYVGASESFYASGVTNHKAFQITFVKGVHDSYPRTRNFLYEKPCDLSDMKEYEVPFASTLSTTQIPGVIQHRT
ncbi:class I SAM-dependent methyltransferase [Candidatus Kaiserbacteria bacterium]|nr:class I SAM-dependent methyltransferase [Candidatus Kaiserbacteria bacterium]